jgi:hypothetical protein
VKKIVTNVNYPSITDDHAEPGESRSSPLGKALVAS